MASRPAAGGGIWVQVAPERIERWCAGFAQRHGGVVEVAATGPDGLDAADDGSGSASGAVHEVRLSAADGALAACVVPFPPLILSPSLSAQPQSVPGVASGIDVDTNPLVKALAAHARVDRTIGVLLVRRGGYAAGVFKGARLIEHKVGSRYVQGRTKAGGWSQQRYARRREGQARQAYAAAADAAEAVLVPRVGRFDAVVAGGDATAVASLRGEPQLAALWAKLTGPLLDVGDPRMADLQRAPEAFRAVRIRVLEPEA
jgi:hypothetical protein